MAEKGAGIEDKLNSVTTGLYSVVSINHRNTAILVYGANAVNALNGGCPRDLSLEAFPAGTCSRTIIGKAEVVLWRTDTQSFHVECWRSFSDYVWKFLVEAARCA
jgi:sarcosine oxidase subunit gamma